VTSLKGHQLSKTLKFQRPESKNGGDIGAKKKLPTLPQKLWCLIFLRYFAFSMLSQCQNIQRVQIR